MSKIAVHVRERAAGLLGRGETQAAVAAEVGVSHGTIKAWLRDEDFRGAVKLARGKALDEQPTARAVLEAALHARLRDGSPDWTNRVKAASLLMKEPPEPEDAEAAVVIRVFDDGTEVELESPED